jgi:hypothetical protein
MSVKALEQGREDKKQPLFWVPENLCKIVQADYGVNDWVSPAV